MIIIMPFCGVYRRFGFVFSYTRPPRFHEQNFPSSCKDELDSAKEESEDQTNNRRAVWDKRRDAWIQYYDNHVPPRKAQQVPPNVVPKYPPPRRPDTTLLGLEDRSNAARDKGFRNRFREGWEEIFPFLVLAVFTARLC